ncbi:hypothetical protein ABIA32_006434 [Streptacidiphilus sp. MAP12-20]
MVLVPKLRQLASATTLQSAHSPVSSTVVRDVREAAAGADGVGPALDQGRVDGDALPASPAEQEVPVVGAGAVAEDPLALRVAHDIRTARVGEAGQGAVDGAQADPGSGGYQVGVQDLGADEAFGGDQRPQDGGALLGGPTERGQFPVGTSGCGGCVFGGGHGILTSPASKLRRCDR